MFILHQLLFWKGRSQKSVALAYVKTVGKQTSKQSCFLFKRQQLLMMATVFSYWFGSSFWMNKFFHNNLEIKKIICLSAQCYKDIHRGA